MPVQEALSEVMESIEDEQDDLLSHAVDEHEKHRDSLNFDHNRVELPKEPLNWSEVIEEERIQDYFDISEIPTTTYGDTLHMMMEDLAEEIEGVEPEYPLHFRKKGDRQDLNREDRIDNTLRPDALGELFVYDFKHMPKAQSNFLDQNGRLKRGRKFRKNVEQVNRYLNELNLPVGMLVYISSDMEIKEKVIERHNRYAPNFEEFIYDREDYNFDNLGSMLEER